MESTAAVKRSIDEIAIAGYEWAEAGGVGIPTDIVSEIDLMAFNAGISNANNRLGLNVGKYIPTQSSMSKEEQDANPYPADHMTIQIQSI